jgi:hypothetical protein
MHDWKRNFMAESAGQSAVMVPPQHLGVRRVRGSPIWKFHALADSRFLS